MITRRVIGAVLVLVAAGLAVAATFLPAYSAQAVFGGRTLESEASFWFVVGDDFRGGLILEPFAFGAPSVAAALVMALAVVIAFRVPAARVASLLGAGALAGVAWSAVEQMQGLLEFAEREQYVLKEVQQGEGVTLLVVAAGVAVVSAVLHQELPRAVRAEPAEGGVMIHQLEDEADDTDTPPYGYPVIVEPKSD